MKAFDVSAWLRTQPDIHDDASVNVGLLARRPAAELRVCQGTSAHVEQACGDNTSGVAAARRGSQYDDSVGVNVMDVSQSPAMRRVMFEIEAINGRVSVEQVLDDPMLSRLRVGVLC